MKKARQTKKILRKFFHSENLDISEEEIELISNILSNQKLEIENELKKTYYLYKKLQIVILEVQ